MAHTTIRISERLHKFLQNNVVRKGESYEEIIWKLLGLKKLNEEQAKEVKAGYEEFI